MTDPICRFLGRFTLTGLLALCLTATPAAALESIDHPDPDDFSEGVAEMFRKGREAFEQQRELGKLGGQDYGRLGMIYQAHEQYVPAQQAYRNAMELAPADARWPYFLGILARADGRFEEAVTLFRRSLENNPEYVPAAIRLARALMDAGEPDLARRNLQELAEEYPNTAAAQADLGLLAAQAGRHEEAIGHLEAALRLQPGANQLHYPLALAYRATGQVEKAREHLALQGPQEPVFLDPLYNNMRNLSRSYAYYMSLGLSAARNDDFAVALDLMKKAVAANPDSPEARINLARMLEANGDIEAGLRELDKVLADHPGNALAHYNKGAMLEILGREAAAREQYAAALASQPEMFEARQLLANSLMRAGDYAQAADHYRRALDARSGRSELLLQRAVAEQADGRCADAVATLMELVRRLPENFEVLIAYSRVVATCPEVDAENRQNALNAARNMYRLNPALPVVITLAMAEAAQGNFEAATDLQAQAIFMAVRDGQETQAEQLRRQMERYRQEMPADQPWSDDQPLLNPRPLQQEDRL